MTHVKPWRALAYLPSEIELGCGWGKGEYTESLLLTHPPTTKNTQHDGISSYYPAQVQTCQLKVGFEMSSMLVDRREMKRYYNY